MGFESDYHKVHKHFNKMMELLEKDSRQQACDAFEPEQRPAPEFMKWTGRNVLPPGHIANQGDFPERPGEE